MYKYLIFGTICIFMQFSAVFSAIHPRNWSFGQHAAGFVVQVQQFFSLLYVITVKFNYNLFIFHDIMV